MQTWFLTQLLTINNLVFGANGENTRAWGQKVGLAAITVILGVFGVGLVGRGIFDVGKGWFSDNKDWKKIGMGVLTIIVGGAFLLGTAATFQAFSKNLGGDLNITG